MLLHVTATHSENNCPAYHQENLLGMMQALERREDLARQFNIRVHYLVSAAPEHSFYALLETDSFPTVSRFLMELFQAPHDYRITLVQSADDLVSAWKPVAQG